MVASEIINLVAMAVPTPEAAEVADHIIMPTTKAVTVDRA
jgi:hypothetical protein